MDDIKQQLVSVVMPCYNAASFVAEAISSVLQQTYPHVEVIVVDDGSDDASPEIIKNLAETQPDRITLMHQDHKGPYPARNLGLRYARGNYIAFLDADDWWRADCLEKLLAAHRMGLRRIMLPKANEKDLPDIPEAVRSELSLIFVETIEEALEAGLTQPIPSHGGNKAVSAHTPSIPQAKNPVMH